MEITNARRAFVGPLTKCLKDAACRLRGFAKLIGVGTEPHVSNEAVANELRSAASGILAAHQRERGRIAQELHDDIGQRLALLDINLGRLSRELPNNPDAIRTELASLRDDVKLMSSAISRLSHELRPMILHDLGLVPGLRRLCHDYSIGRAQRISFFDSDVPRSIAEQIGTALYQIAKEALRNVAEHGAKDPVTVMLTGAPHAITLEIKDSGPGFHLNGTSAPVSLGFTTMYEQAKLICGKMDIESEVGESTCVRVEVPLTA